MATRTEIYNEQRGYFTLPDWFELEPIIATESNATIATFLSHNIGMFISYGMTTFTTSDLYTTNYLSDPPAASTFAAPATVDSAQWATEAANLGCGYAILTTGHHIGFNTFPYTAQYNGGVSENTEDSTRGTLSVPVYSSYDVSDTSSDQNIIGKFLDQCVTEGIKSGLYYNIGKNINMRRGLDLIDASYDLTGTFSATYDNYVAYVIDEVEWLVTNYDFDYFWIDAPHHFPRYYLNNKYNYQLIRDVYRAIKAIKPNILVIVNYDCADTGSLEILGDGTDNTRPPFSHDGRDMITFPCDVIGLEYFRVPDNPAELAPEQNHDFGSYYIPKQVISTIYQNGQYFARNDVFQTLESAATLQTKYDYCQTNNIPFLLNVAPQKNGVIMASHLTRFGDIVL